MSTNSVLPAYTNQDIKQALLDVGASGTIYSLVMPETEEAISFIIDGGTPAHSTTEEFEIARNTEYFSMYHEPWTQKQDEMHEAYFKKWFEWSAPVVTINKDDFPHQYPTAGASEGIFKLMAEYAAKYSGSSLKPTIHVFEGEYEGFPAFADSLNLNVMRHKREDWKNIANKIDKGEQFWISQPSAINGMVWENFDAFVTLINEKNPSAEIVPDLTYVGSVARNFNIDLTSPNIKSVIFSHSKPFGLYYHRVGGVISKENKPSLFGNKWFKNLQSLKIATEMMERHGVHDLPRQYRAIQEQAAKEVSRLLGNNTKLEAADVNLLGIAKPSTQTGDLLANVLRGSGDETVIRLCLTPMMTTLINPDMAPRTAPKLLPKVR